MKDQISLVEATAALLRRHPSVRLQIVGDGPEMSRLQQAVAAQGLHRVVRLSGERADIPRSLATLDVFALPSLGEGMSNTLLEAMAAGLPVVATRVGGNPELVSDGTSGLLVPPRDKDALVEALSVYVESRELRRRHGAEGRQRILREFTVERMAAGYAGLYRDELARWRGAR